MDTILNYNIEYQNSKGKEEKPLSNEVKMSMQEKLNNRLAATQPHDPGSPMAQPAQSDGFGRTV